MLYVDCLFILSCVVSGGKVLEGGKWMGSNRACDQNRLNMEVLAVGMRIR